MGEAVCAPPTTYAKRLCLWARASLGFGVLQWEGPGLTIRIPSSDRALLPPGCVTLGKSLP